MAEFIWTRTITREETGTVDIDAEDIVSQLRGYADITESRNGTVTIEYQFSVEDIYENFSQDVEWEADEVLSEGEVTFKEVVG